MARAAGSGKAKPPNSANTVKNSRTRGLRPWKKGESGNPNGRPKVAVHYRERCRTFMDEKGWQALHDMANDPECRDRFNALKLLAAYAIGSPIQSVESTPPATAIKVELVDATASASDGD